MTLAVECDFRIQLLFLLDFEKIDIFLLKKENMD